MLPSLMRVMGDIAHPTQAMLAYVDDSVVSQGRFDGLKIAIVGDFCHSRLARSQLQALERRLGVSDYTSWSWTKNISAQLFR